MRTELYNRYIAYEYSFCKDNEESVRHKYPVGYPDRMGADVGDFVVAGVLYAP